LLLYPGFVSKVEDLRDAPFGVSSVPEACLEFQQRVAGEEGLDGSRRLCDKLLFQSGLVEALGRSPDAARYVEDLVDQAVAAESRCAIPSVRRKNLLRILDLAVRRAPSAGSKERYRAARDDLQFRSVTASRTTRQRVPFASHPDCLTLPMYFSLLDEARCRERCRRRSPRALFR
jgi:hypothetical protein